MHSALNASVISHHLPLTLQDQYKFLHTAVRELLLCGDTTLKSTDLRAYITSMAQVDKEKNKPGFEALFEVHTSMVM